MNSAPLLIAARGGASPRLTSLRIAPRRITPLLYASLRSASRRNAALLLASPHTASQRLIGN